MGHRICTTSQRLLGLVPHQAIRNALTIATEMLLSSWSLLRILLVMTSTEIGKRSQTIVSGYEALSGAGTIRATAGRCLGLAELGGGSTTAIVMLSGYLGGKVGVDVGEEAG